MTGSGRGKPTGRLGVFLTICTFSFLVNFGRVAFAPLVDVFIESGISPATAGLAATAVWVGSALPRLPTGYLLTFVSRHRTILGMGVALSAAAAFTALAGGIWLAILGASLIGLATGVFYIAANPLVSELYPENVGLAVGLRGMSSQLAAVAAPFLVGLAIVLGTWRIAFGALSVLAMVAVVAFGVAVRRAELPRAGAADRDLLGGIRAQWPLVLAGIVFVGFSGFVWQGVFNFYVTFLGTKAIASGTASALLTLTFAAGVPSFVIVGRLADRFSHIALLLSVLAGFSLCLLAFTLVEGVLAVAAVSILMGGVIHGLFPAGDAYLLDSLPDEHRASAYAGFSATMMLMQAPGSVAVGLFAQGGVGYEAVFLVYAAIVGAIAVAMAGLARAGRLPTGS
jgi:MFS family permease